MSSGKLAGDPLSVDAVHDALRAAILRGELEPGQELSQVQLATRLGVSRTPLREALRLLQREGLVDSRANRRVRVAALSAEDLDDLYALRLVAECSALRISAPRLTPEEIADLEGQMAQMAHYAAAADYERWEIPHRAFHRGLARHNGPRILRELAELSDHASRYRRFHLSTADARERAEREHRAILDAVQAEDVDAAAARLAEHLAHTPLAVIPQIEPGYEPRAIRAVLATLTGRPDAAAHAR
jgi:GntR family transcriptional regulator, rspAB operon transcriptional repressor